MCQQRQIVIFDGKKYCRNKTVVVVVEMESEGEAEEKTSRRNERIKETEREVKI